MAVERYEILTKSVAVIPPNKDDGDSARVRRLRRIYKLRRKHQGHR